MNSRERARLILDHQEADRPAIDLGSTEVTGTSVWSYRALKRALGLPDDTARVYCMIEMLAEVETPVLDALGADFAMLPPTPLRYGLHYGQWKPYTFWDGQTFEVPADFEAQEMPDGSLLTSSTPGGPKTQRMPKGGWFFDAIPSDHWDPFDVQELPESEWRFQESLPDEELHQQQEMAKALYESTDRAIVGMPWVNVPAGYANFWWFAIKMANDPHWCQDYMMRAGEATAKCFDEYLQAVGQYIEVCIVGLHDYGLQDREWFRPSFFKEFYVPAWKMCTDAVHRYPGVKTWIHCCGSVPNLIPYFIEAGVDCLNPVQWSAAGMDLRTLKNKYGDKIVFWGGATNTQNTFPFGTPEDVAAETQEILELMCPGGGYVVNPIHNVLPEVPVENIIALYRTAMAYRYR